MKTQNATGEGIVELYNQHNRTTKEEKTVTLLAEWKREAEKLKKKLNEGHEALTNDPATDYACKYFTDNSYTNLSKLPKR